MATARTRVLELVDSRPEPSPYDAPVEISIDEDTGGVTLHGGAAVVEHPDGSATVDFNPDRSGGKASDDFDANLAHSIDQGDLDQIASDLLAGIEMDEQSRREWLQTRARGIQLLGLKLEEPRGDIGTSSAPLEGMSTVRHPLLLEATIRFQATARGELLPAAGPVKVRNDATSPSPPPTAGAPSPMAPPAAPPVPVSLPGPAASSGGQRLEELAQALERDMNHYLTVTATEYVPDTDRMLFYIGFGGDGFKKVYNCPLRRRPVSESVDAEDIIVSNAATDIRNCGRVTHKIKMRPSILKRMQIVGAYRDVDLKKPSPTEQPNAVEQAKADITGSRAQPQRPEDADYTVYETYCELDIDKFAPKQFKGKGLPLPYRVTLERESRQVLDVRRNWDEHDEQCLAKHFLVQFPFIRGLGFYGLGLIHVLGNATVTLTALWREFIDAGMFANFPGFLYAKSVGRQLSNQLRVPPGGGQAVDVPPGMAISQAVMPLPYKEPGASFTAFVQHVEEVGQRLGQTADVSVGEGKQETPVGTIMAQIEQATKVMDSVHKRLHAAQAEEFQLLKERFREDPEAFWRHNKRPVKQWTKDQFIEALDKWELVPVADPNNPTSLHRIAKAVAILQLATTYQQYFNAKEVLLRIFRIVGIDPEGLLNDQPAPPPPDPRFAAIQAKAQAEQIKGQIAWVQTQIKASEAQSRAQDAAAERESREKLAQLKLMEGYLKIEQEKIIHAHDLQRDSLQTSSELHANQLSTLQDLSMKAAQHHSDMAMQQDRHQQSLAADSERHQQDLEHERQLAEAKVEAMRAQAKVKPKGDK